MDTPIICHLAESDARTRIDEWQELLQSTVAMADRISPTILSLGLKDTSCLTALVDLSQRELACCPFLGFSIQIDAGTVTLQITSPAEAIPILDVFASLAAEAGSSVPLQTHA